jgi:hypothetical protein
MSNINVLWGKYKEFEGPYYPGNIDYKLPENHDVWDRVLASVAATEGKMNSINMYDSCIVSAGIIQWCEKNFLGVTNLIDAFMKSNETKHTPILNDAFKEIKSFVGFMPFKKQSNGSWRFVDKSNNIIDKEDEQRNFFLGCDGKKGSWNQRTFDLSKTWARCLAKFMSAQEMTEFQSNYTKEKIKTIYYHRDVRSIIEQISDQTIKELALCFYISFSANHPKFAKDNFISADARMLTKRGSKEWLLEVIKEMTFKNNIEIYPKRFEKVSMVLNKLYPAGIIPIKASDLKTS